MTKGNDFLHISPKEFITLLNPEVSSEVQEDLASKPSNPDIEINPSQDIKRPNDFYKLVISETLTKFDPMKIIMDIQYQADEYDSEAAAIYNRLPKCNSYHDVYTLILNVFKRSFSGMEMQMTAEEYHALVDNINLFRIEMRKNESSNNN